MECSRLCLWKNESGKNARALQQKKREKKRWSEKRKGWLIYYRCDEKRTRNQCLALSLSPHRPKQKKYAEITRKRSHNCAIPSINFHSTDEFSLWNCIFDMFCGDCCFLCPRNVCILSGVAFFFFLLMSTAHQKKNRWHIFRHEPNQIQLINMFADNVARVAYRHAYQV